MSNMMNDLSEGIVKREMVLFFIIDQSGSMAGTKMGAVNTAIREVIPELKTAGGADVDLKVAVLLFSSGCRWMHPAPVSVESFVWNNIEAQGVTDLGAACTELSRKMSKDGFMKSASGSVAPALFLMSDGQPTDDFMDGIEKLKNNKWFKYAIKVAVAIGDDADINALAKFTGSTESVVKVHTPEALKKMIRFVSVTSSQVGSQNAGVSGGSIQTKQDNMIQQIQNCVQADPTLDPNSTVSTDASDW